MHRSRAPTTVRTATKARADGPGGERTGATRATSPRSRGSPRSCARRGSRSRSSSSSGSRTPASRTPSSSRHTPRSVRTRWSSSTATSISRRASTRCRCTTRPAPRWRRCSAAPPRSGPVPTARGRRATISPGSPVRSGTARTWSSCGARARASATSSTAQRAHGSRTPSGSRASQACSAARSPAT